MSNATHDAKVARAKALLGKHYLLHPDNRVARKPPAARRWALDADGRTPLDDELDDPRRGQAEALNRSR